MTTPQDFVGHWNFAESDNFDSYLKEAGVGFMTRKMATSLKPTLDFEVNGDHWKIVSTSTFKTIPTEFDLGKEFDETTGDGRSMKSTFTFENGKLIQVQKPVDPSKDKESRFERYIEDGKLIITMECNGVKAKRIYTKA